MLVVTAMWKVCWEWGADVVPAPDEPLALGSYVGAAGLVVMVTEIAVLGW